MVPTLHAWALQITLIQEGSAKSSRLEHSNYIVRPENNLELFDMQKSLLQQGWAEVKTFLG